MNETRTNRRLGESIHLELRMTNSEENQLAEAIATLLDKYLDTSIDDMTHINELITQEKEEARRLKRQNSP